MEILFFFVKMGGRDRERGGNVCSETAGIGPPRDPPY
jgi:hypothetical protein